MHFNLTDPTDLFNFPSQSGGLPNRMSSIHPGLPSVIHSSSWLFTLQLFIVCCLPGSWFSRSLLIPKSVLEEQRHWSCSVSSSYSPESMLLYKPFLLFYGTLLGTAFPIWVFLHHPRCYGYFRFQDHFMSFSL